MTSPIRPPRLLKGLHLLGIEEMSSQEIVALLDLAERYVEVNRQIEKRHDLLARHFLDAKQVQPFEKARGTDGGCH